jgi:hypothetical protein
LYFFVSHFVATLIFRIVHILFQSTAIETSILGKKSDQDLAIKNTLFKKQGTVSQGTLISVILYRNTASGAPDNRTGRQGAED